MSRKAILRNELPPLPADCLLPKFEVPRLSTDLLLDAPFYKSATQPLVTDPFLGVPIEFVDLSVYSQPVKDDDITESDLKYLPELAEHAQATSLIVPAARLSARPSQRHDDVTKAQHTTEARSRYLKSPFYDSLEHPAIHSQLESAFHGNVPPGAVSLIREGPPMKTLVIKGAESIDPDATLLISRGRKFVKSIPRPEKDSREPVRAERAFQLAGGEVGRAKCYFHVEENGEVTVGLIEEKLFLKPMAPREMKVEEMTATPVVFIGDADGDADMVELDRYRKLEEQDERELEDE
jgi:hypothetical protein